MKPNTQLPYLLKALIWIIALESIGFLSGLVTESSLGTWYSTLHKSALTPAPWVFPVAWSLLYAMLGLTGAYLWHNTASSKAALTQTRGAFVVQLVCNWAWTPIFFYAQAPFIALLVLIAAVISTLGCMTFAWQAKLKPAVGLLTPYTLWLIFATYLNGFIWLGN